MSDGANLYVIPFYSAGNRTQKRAPEAWNVDDPLIAT